MSKLHPVARRILELQSRLQNEIDAHAATKLELANLRKAANQVWDDWTVCHDAAGDEYQIKDVAPETVIVMQSALFEKAPALAGKTSRNDPGGSAA